MWIQIWLQSNILCIKYAKQMEKYTKGSSSGFSLLLIVRCFINNLSGGIEYFIEVPVEKIILDLIISYQN